MQLLPGGRIEIALQVTNLGSVVDQLVRRPLVSPPQTYPFGIRVLPALADLAEAAQPLAGQLGSV